MAKKKPVTKLYDVGWVDRDENDFRGGSGYYVRMTKAQTTALAKLFRKEKFKLFSISQVVASKKQAGVTNTHKDFMDILEDLYYEG